jgi:hypothetical protein
MLYHSVVGFAEWSVRSVGGSPARSIRTHRLSGLIDPVYFKWPFLRLWSSFFRFFCSHALRTSFLYLGLTFRSFSSLCYSFSFSYSLSFGFFICKLLSDGLPRCLTFFSLFLYFISFFSSWYSHLKLFVLYSKLVLILRLFYGSYALSNSGNLGGAKKACLTFIFTFIVQMHSFSIFPLLLFIKYYLA